MATDDTNEKPVELSDQSWQFIEEFGGYFSQGGSSRMYGRVIGLLLIAPPIPVYPQVS